MLIYKFIFVFLLQVILSSFAIYCEKAGKNTNPLTFKLNKAKSTVENHFDKYRHLAITNTSIFGNSSQIYYYYVQVLIGNPPKPQAFITDTGSHLMATPCGDLCKHCGKHINSYYETKSNIELLLII